MPTNVIAPKVPYTGHVVSPVLTPSQTDTSEQFAIVVDPVGDPNISGTIQMQGTNDPAGNTGWITLSSFGFTGGIVHANRDGTGAAITLQPSCVMAVPGPPFPLKLRGVMDIVGTATLTITITTLP